MIRERAIDAGALTGSAALVVAAWWTAGQIRDHPVSAPIARPAATVTVTATQQPVVGRTATPAPPRPSASATSARAAESPVEAAGRQPNGRVTAAERPRPGTGTPSGPSPTPTVQPAMCDGPVLSAQVLRAACVSVGGSR